jgi:hypothetical protein
MQAQARWHGLFSAKAVTGPTPRIFDQLRTALRLRHYSARTEEAYLGWARRFAAFCGYRGPRQLTADDVRAYLDALATRGVSASTQNQALGALQSRLSSRALMSPRRAAHLARWADHEHRSATALGRVHDARPRARARSLPDHRVCNTGGS